MTSAAHQPQIEAGQLAAQAITALVNAGVLAAEDRIQLALMLTPKGGTPAREAILDALP